MTSKSSAPTPAQLEALYALPSEGKGSLQQPRLPAHETPLSAKVPHNPRQRIIFPFMSPEQQREQDHIGEEIDRKELEFRTLGYAISGAILALRKKLKKSQWDMVCELGCTSSTYLRWEKGSSVPSGPGLIKLINLCPDDESRARFGLDVSKFK